MSGEEGARVLEQQQGVEARILGVGGRPVALLLISITPTALVYLRVLDKMRLLAKRLATDFAAERLLTRVGPQVYLDVRLVQETSIAYGTPMYGLFLTKSLTVTYCRRSGCRFAPRPVLGLFGGCGGVRVTDLQLRRRSGTVHRVVAHEVGSGHHVARWAVG